MNIYQNYFMVGLLYNFPNGKPTKYPFTFLGVTVFPNAFLEVTLVLKLPYSYVFTF